jgi:hypothetical protein
MGTTFEALDGGKSTATPNGRLADRIVRLWGTYWRTRSPRTLATYHAARDEYMARGGRWLPLSDRLDAAEVA